MSTPHTHAVSNLNDDGTKITNNGITPQGLVKHLDGIINELKQEHKAGEFPIDVLPEPFYSFVIETNKALNFPVEYTATAVLSAVSTVVGKGVNLKVKNGWKEYAALYCALVGNPGATKSHPVDISFEAIKEIDKAEIEVFAKKHSEYEQAQSLKSAKNAESAKCNQVEKPILQKTLLNNFSPEILDIRLADSERGCTVYSDELATFLEGMNNYSKGDQASKYLSYWSNKYTSVDRVKNPIPITIARPYLNIIGTLQPKVLARLFPANKIDNGFLQRFLFAFSDAKKSPINENEVNPNVIERYNDWFTNFRKKYPIEYSYPESYPLPKTFNWSEQAKQYFFEWQRKNTDLVNQYTGDLLGEVYSKFDNHFCRLALLMQVMIDNSVFQISIEAVQAADRLCEYYKHTARRVVDIIHNMNPVELLPTDRATLYNSLPEIFTTGEGIQLADTLGIGERSAKYFFKTKNLFAQPKYGNYSKIH